MQKYIYTFVHPWNIPRYSGTRGRGVYHVLPRTLALSAPDVGLSRLRVFNFPSLHPPTKPSTTTNTTDSKARRHPPLQSFWCIHPVHIRPSNFPRTSAKPHQVATMGDVQVAIRMIANLKRYIAEEEKIRNEWAIAVSPPSNSPSHLHI